MGKEKLPKSIKIMRTNFDHKQNAKCFFFYDTFEQVSLYTKAREADGF